MKENRGFPPERTFFRTSNGRSSGMVRRAINWFRREKVLWKPGEHWISQLGWNNEQSDMLKRIMSISKVEYEAARIELVRHSQLELYPELYHR